MTLILAIETSSELASCALLNTGRSGADALLSRESSGVRTHSQSVLPMVQDLLNTAGVKLADCAAIAFGAGPGSFTGVRTACGVVQGLAFGAGLPVLPLVTLEAMAEACRARTGATDVLAVLDARMNEVYWAQYRWNGAWEVVCAPALCAPEAVAPVDTAGLAACGNGFAVYPDAFAGKAFAAGAQADILPHARDMAVLGAAALARGQAVAADAAQPLYLRNKVAYTSAERVVINAAKAAADGQGQGPVMSAHALLALRPMVRADVDEVHALECSVFPHPWSRTNFLDSLASGYDAWVVREPADGTLAGYFLLMYAVDEAHLLDVAVAAPRQGTGLGRHLMDRIAARARAQRMTSILLEVRPSNERALEVYRRYGYAEIGRRKGYYPAHEGRREDAIVMRYVL